ncbi:hypothetical protein [Gloeocapsopsis sp. IPPAS B-1203]|nr:hypothetical protein [Gloeocapsopsis sp. IPPAS B-1203]
MQDSNVINFRQDEGTFHQSLEVNGDRILSSKLLTRGKYQALSIL